MGKRMVSAIEANMKAGREVETAERRVRNFLDHLFTALKDRDKAYMEQRKTDARLRKLRGF